jgi:hypothetical protein
VTDAPPPEDAPADPRDVLIREQAAQLEAQIACVCGPSAGGTRARQAIYAALRDFWAGSGSAISSMAG